MCKRFEKKGFAISVNGCLGLIRVVLCDDHDLFRHGLAEMLTIADDIEVVGEANTDERAVDIVSEAKPDAVLLDLEMPGGGPKRRCAGYSGSRSRPRSSSPCTTRHA
jgi:DNA-binding NarL/FixJ family response regulator